MRPLNTRSKGQPRWSFKGGGVKFGSAGVRIIFNDSEGLLDVPSDVTVHTSNPAVELLHARYFHLA